MLAPAAPESRLLYNYPSVPGLFSLLYVRKCNINTLCNIIEIQSISPLTENKIMWIFFVLLLFTLPKSFLLLVRSLVYIVPILWVTRVLKMIPYTSLPNYTNVIVTRFWFWWGTSEASSELVLINMKVCFFFFFWKSWLFSGEKFASLKKWVDNPMVGGCPVTGSFPSP